MPRHAAPDRDSLMTVATALALAAGISPWAPADPEVLGLTALAAVVFAGATRALRSRYPGRPGFSWADRVTLARLAITAVLIGQLAGEPTAPASAWTLAGLALAALVLDGVDGWLARRLDQASAFGARLDMETDALLILVLCALIWAAQQTGAWVLAIGGLRYAFLLAQAAWPRLGTPLPASQRRRLICALQVGVLPLCLLPILPPPGATLLTGTALLLLCYSFTVDIRWLVHHGTPQHEPE